MKDILALCFLALLVFVSCTRKVTQEELIRTAVDLRLSQWKAEELSLCKERAMDRAEDYVDSFLLAISLQSKLDTIPKPVKPVRPEKPAFRDVPDSIKVNELLKK